MASQKHGGLECKVNTECGVFYRSADGKYFVRTFPHPVLVYDISQMHKNAGKRIRNYVLSSALWLSCGLAGSGLGVLILKSGIMDKENAARISGRVTSIVESKINPGSANITYHPGAEKVYPPLSSKEGSELDALVGKRKAVQDFIDNQTKYRYDREQFEGSLCEKGLDEKGNEKGCDVWVSAAHFYRFKKGDCDDILAFAHYLLKDGIALYLGYEDKPNGGHAVYVHKDNGKYSIVSINKNEQTEAKFQSVEEAANFVRGPFDFYQVVKLSDDPEKLLYGFDIKKDAAFGPTIDFPAKAEEKGN